MAEQENEKNSILDDSRTSRNRHRYTPISGSNGYEELLEGSVPCPTCRGKGNIPKEQEGELIALIPVRDKRLKPRRTWLYVGIAVILCVITAGLLFFFLSIRDVTIDSSISLLTAKNLTISETKKYVYFDIAYRFNISNSNYFAITLTQTTMVVEFNVKVVNTSDTSFSLNVPMRSTREFDVNIGITFDKDNGLGGMANRCSMEPSFFTQNIMIFQTTATYSSLGHKEQTTVNTYPLVDCGNHTSLISPVYKAE